MRIRGVAVPVLLSFALAPAGALGVCPDPPMESPLLPGEVGLFFDAAGTVSCANPAVGVPTRLYVVARAPAGGIGAYSIPWLAPRSLPPGMTFLSNTTELPEGSAFDLGQTADWCHQAIPRDPGCAVAEGELVVLGVIDITLNVPVSGTARFGTLCPTFAGPRAEPVWYEACGSTEPLFLQGGDRLSIGFGEGPVANPSESWSTLKARFPGRN